MQDKGKNGEGSHVLGQSFHIHLASKPSGEITRWSADFSRASGINRERDGLELCKKYMDMVPFGVLHVVRNGYFGDLDEFQLYEGSKLKIAVDEQGKSLYFHKLTDIVYDVIRNNNIAIADAVEDKERFKMGSRTVLNMWRERYIKMFDEVMG